MFHYNFSLSNEKLDLKLLDDSHKADFHAITNNPKIADIISFLSYPVARSVTDDWIDKNQGNVERAYGIFVKTGALLGQISAHLSGNDIEIGYWVGVDYWGQGIASDALKLLSTDLKAVNPESIVFAECLPENAASLRVLQKGGFLNAGLPGNKPGRIKLIYT